MSRLDFRKIQKARAGEPAQIFVENRRMHFADVIREQIERIRAEREGLKDKRGFDDRLTNWAALLRCSMRNARRIWYWS